MKIKLLFIFFLISFFLNACDFNDKEEESDAFSQTSFTQPNIYFDDHLVLSEDRVFKAEKIFFQPNTKLINSKYNLEIHADEIYFDSTMIYSFDGINAGCGQAGVKAGNILIKSNRIFGEFTLNANSQNGGGSGFECERKKKNGSGADGPSVQIEYQKYDKVFLNLTALNGNKGKPGYAFPIHASTLNGTQLRDHGKNGEPGQVCINSECRISKQ